MNPTFFQKAKYLIGICFPLVTLLTACQKEKGPCEDLICDLQLTSVLVHITDQDNKAVVLDSLQIQFADGGKTITRRYREKPYMEEIQKSGNYIVLWDSEAPNPKLVPFDVEFRGFRDGELVASTSLVIMNDCCHVKLVSGNTQLKARI